MIRAVVFDMDGLLFDTETIAIDGLMYAGEVMQCSIHREVIMKTIGHNLKSTIEIYKKYLGEDFDFARANALHVEYMYDYIARHGAPLKPGAIELIEYIKSVGLSVALASSSEKYRIELCLQSAGLLDFFQKRISGDMVEHSKPAPDIYLAACAAINVPPAECIAVEDSPAGIESAYAAGLYPIMVPDLITPDDTTRKIAKVILPDLFGVIDVIKKLME